MSGKIINLRKAKKARDRDEKAKRAEQNRQLHGRTKAQKKIDLFSKRKAETELEAHRLDRAQADKDQTNEVRTVSPELDRGDQNSDT